MTIIYMIGRTERPRHNNKISKKSLRKMNSTPSVDVVVIISHSAGEIQVYSPYIGDRRFGVHWCVLKNIKRAALRAH